MERSKDSGRKSKIVLWKHSNSFVHQGTTTILCEQKTLLFHSHTICSTKVARVVALCTRHLATLAHHSEERNLLIRWLNISLLKTLYGRGSDGVLTKVRKTIQKNLPVGYFPIGKIVDSYKGTSRDLTFNAFFVDELLDTQIGQPNCWTILALLIARNRLHSVTSC